MKKSIRVNMAFVLLTISGTAVFTTLSMSSFGYSFWIACGFALFSFVWLGFEYLLGAEKIEQKAPVWHIGEAEKINFENIEYNGNRPYASIKKSEEIQVKDIKINKRD